MVNSGLVLTTMFHEKNIVHDFVISKIEKTESLKNVQHNKIENVAGL
jgi:hypothetical protein